MAQVIFSEQAKRDLRRILTDLGERAGYRVAERYAADFKTTYRRLADFPASGPRRPTLGPHARIAIVLPYLVIYDCVDEGKVTVLRILHGKRNITRDLVR